MTIDCRLRNPDALAHVVEREMRRAPVTHKIKGRLQERVVQVAMVI